MKRLFSGLNYIRKLFVCYIKYNPKLIISLCINYFVLRTLGIKKNIKIQIYNQKLEGPNEFHFFYTTSEVFYRKLYRKLTNCNHILDLGGYMGESAIRFAQHNKKVSVYEPSKKNFYYLEKNVKKSTNIVAYNKAVITKDDTNMYYEGDNFSPGGKITDNNTGDNNKIDCISIKTVIQADMDGLKMDIEGFEYDIIKYMMDKDMFVFKKGYIEFHHLANKEKNKFFDDFRKFLLSKKYSFQIEDIYGNQLEKNGNLHQETLVIYFETTT